MPLLDHFHAPLVDRHPWESFHSVWAAELMGWLNRILPRRFLAVVQTHLGRHVEADVAEFEQSAEPGEDEGNGEASGGVAVQTYAPPAVALVMPAVYPDDLEVQIRDERVSGRLAAVVELVSPGNQDRPEARRAFAAKCAAYLERGIGVVTIDIVTSHHFNMHNELVDLLRLDTKFAMPESAQPVYCRLPAGTAQRQERNRRLAGAADRGPKPAADAPCPARLPRRPPRSQHHLPRSPPKQSAVSQRKAEAGTGKHSGDAVGEATLSSTSLAYLEPLNTRS